MSHSKLPSWRPGATRERIEAFLDGAEMLPIEQRVAVFDIDGTLWCERPQPPMIAFLRDELAAAVERDPSLGQRPEYRAALEWDRAAVARLGEVNVGLALVELHAGMTPEAYEARARAWFESARHPDRGVPLSQMRYRPMLELIGELRARHFAVHLVTGVGVEFVRAVSEDLFGVRPEGIVGSQVGYEQVHEAGRPRLLRTRESIGDPNDGAARVASIQRVLGRRSILVAGDAVGDAEMLEYAAAFEGPSLSLVIAHDDGAREYEDTGAQRLMARARQQDWTVVSMRTDWETLFADT